MRRGRRIAFVGAHRPLELLEGRVDDPAPGAVLVRTTIAGVCGTDAHRLDGDLPDPDHPVAFGHEGVGIIEALGAGVSTDAAGTPVRAGDPVYWTPSGDRPDRPSPLGWPPPADVPNPAAYQDYATLPPSNVFYRIPDDTSPEAVIAFGCAMPTALGGMTRLGGIRNGQTVVVQGSGPVGLASTLLASLSTARQVIVIGAPGARLDVAKGLGASTTISLESTTAGERGERIRDLTEGCGADVVIEAAGQISAFEEGMGLLAEGGRYLILGLYSGRGSVDFDPIQLNNRNLAVIGSLGPVEFSDFTTTIDLARRHGSALAFGDLITHRYPLSRTEEAIAMARSGAAIKTVVLPGLDADI
ncbi:MAG: zinc-binding dehydrogenase [Deltaproteobacteria bacterium]|jgi:5-exo-hydroxycamphor dehydrogenase|nr:zinc-binding dehydrogenase [Deltaproteobacteria bacterium]MBW2499579.1 zinc-binding dehydrogenase [Deltaproteobacteria bacterium]